VQIYVSKTRRWDGRNSDVKAWASGGGAKRGLAYSSGVRYPRHLHGRTKGKESVRKKCRPSGLSSPGKGEMKRRREKALRLSARSRYLFRCPETFIRSIAGGTTLTRIRSVEQNGGQKKRKKNGGEERVGFLFEHIEEVG